MMSEQLVTASKPDYNVIPVQLSTEVLIVNYFLTWMTIRGRCTKSEVKDANMVVIQVEWLPWAVKNHYRLV